MANIGLYLPDSLVDRIDEMINYVGFASRSELMRHLLEVWVTENDGRLPRENKLKAKGA